MRSLTSVCPAPIDIQVSGSNQRDAYNIAQELRREIRTVKGVGDVLIPQDLDYPALRLDVNREMASRLGLSSKEVVNNVITALTSNQMIAPSYWVDPKTGNDYMLTVQYPDSQIKTMSDSGGDSAALSERRRYHGPGGSHKHHED